MLVRSGRGGEVGGEVGGEERRIGDGEDGAAGAEADDAQRVRFGGAGDVDGDGGGWERGLWHLCGGVV